MKTYIIIWILSLAMVFQSHAQQNRLNLGGGYFGQTLTYPGLVLEIESERVFSEKAALPIRLDLGFYVHERYNSGLFLDLNFGFRRYFNSGFYLEESMGFGILETFLNSDGTYEVDPDGNVSQTTSANPPDFMPSLTLGLGYDLTKNSEKRNMIWIRPKLSWQIPHKTSSQYFVALQIGFTHTIAIK